MIQNKTAQIVGTLASIAALKLSACAPADLHLLQEEQHSLTSHSPTDAVWHLTFDEGSGDATADKTKQGHRALLHGAPRWRTNDNGYVLVLDGIDDYADQAPLNLARSNFTVALRMRATRYEALAPIYSNRQGNGQRIGFELRWASVPNTLQALVDFGDVTATTQVPLPVGQWKNVAVSVDRHGDMTLYLDGLKVGQTDISTHSHISLTHGSPVRIGTRALPNVFFEGEIDNAVGFNRALSPETILNLFRAKPIRHCFSNLFSDASAFLERPFSARPQYLQPVRDPIFGTHITRVTDPQGAIPGLDLSWGPVARHHYSRDQAWNADQSLLLLNKGTKGALFLDGRTYKPLFQRRTPGKVRWHPTRPELLVYASDNQIGTWAPNVDPQKDVITPLATFHGYSELSIGKDEGTLSDDGKLVALLARDSSGATVVFAFDLQSNKRFDDIVLTGRNIDSASISPRGNYIIVKGDDLDSNGGADDQNQVYSLTGRKVGSLWSQRHRPGHYDLTIDSQGDQVAVGISKSPPDAGLVIKRRLSDGRVTRLTNHGWASHTSTRNIRRRGWAYVTYRRQYDTVTKRPFYDEIVAVSLDGVRDDGSYDIHRLAHTHAMIPPPPQDDYKTEQHGSVSPDGTKVIFGSNWGDPNGDIAAYVVDLCL